MKKQAKEKKPVDTTCSTCRHFHSEWKHWVTSEPVVWTTGRFFKTEHCKQVDTHRQSLTQECRRFPKYEPRGLFDTCGEHQSAT